jgi:N-acetylmuramoyl-L-alanine amidase CwlA
MLLPMPLCDAHCFYTLPSGKKNWVSWHFTVDDVEAVQHLPITERAIHAGAGNGGLGIESACTKASTKGRPIFAPLGWSPNLLMI